MSKSKATKAANKDEPSPDTSLKHNIVCAFDKFASIVTRWAGSPIAFGLAVVSLVVWAAAGPIFKYSENWQLVVNTGTTIITFLMVFLIQQSQNKDSAAVHLKLDELISSSKAANNKLLGIQDATEEDLRKMAAYYASLADKVTAPREDGGNVSNADAQ